jgi:hypothetical protein
MDQNMLNPQYQQQANQNYQTYNNGAPPNPMGGID